MGRYLVTVSAVMVDATVSGLTWSCDTHPAWVVLAAATSALGLVIAANKLADGVFTPDDATA